MSRWLLILALLIPLSACRRAPSTSAGSADPPTTEQVTALPLRDWVAEPAVLPEDAHEPCPRLLSTAPNVTEMCCALGLANCLIGRTRYCIHPPAVADVPTIGALNDLNVETLIELKPELIIVSGTSRAITERLAPLGLRFETVPDDTLPDLFASITRIGALTNRPQSAHQLVAHIQADLATVIDHFANAPARRVLIALNALTDPPTQFFAAGPDSFYDDLLRLAGHENAVAPGSRGFTPVALEFILDADPDVIIELVPDSASRPGGDADARAAWAKVGPLQAVATQRVHVVAGPQHFILGPRIAQTFAAICQAIADGDAEAGHD